MTGRRIVVVEDTDDLRELMVELLNERGYEAHGAGSGLEGVERIVALTADIALVDVGLPDIDGYEVARRIRSDANIKQPCLVALTGYGGPAERERSRNAGFDRHLTKPVDLQVLTQTLQEVCG